MDRRDHSNCVFDAGCAQYRCGIHRLCAALNLFDSDRALGIPRSASRYFGVAIVLRDRRGDWDDALDAVDASPMTGSVRADQMMGATEFTLVMDLLLPCNTCLIRVGMGTWM